VKLLGGVIFGLSVFVYLVVLLVTRLMSSPFSAGRLIISGLASLSLIGIGLVVFGVYRDRHEQRN
jgi:hypothetical protein